MERWPVLKPDRGALIRALNVGCRGREQMQLILRWKSGVQGFAQRPRFHHEAEWTWVVAGFLMVEMQMQPRWRLAGAAIADANVPDWIGRDIKHAPKPRLLQQCLRPRGDRVSPAVEGRVLHRRQGI